MSNGIGRSKENLPTDANHVSAKDRAYQNVWQSKNNKSVMAIEDNSKSSFKNEGAFKLENDSR